MEDISNMSNTSVRPYVLLKSRLTTMHNKRAWTQRTCSIIITINLERPRANGGFQWRADLIQSFIELVALATFSAASTESQWLLAAAEVGLGKLCLLSSKNSQDPSLLFPRPKHNLITRPLFLSAQT